MSNLSIETTLANFDHWARTVSLAAAIPPDVDLDDDVAVIRSLYAKRFCWGDMVGVLDDAIELARERRQGK